MENISFWLICPERRRGFTGKMRRFYGIAMCLLCSAAAFSAEVVKSEMPVESVYATQDRTFFGSMVAVDGDRLAAATRNYEGRTNYVEVFGRSGNTWNSEAVFGFAGTNVVQSIDLSGDRLAVGIDLPGEVRVYERGTAGWSLVDTLAFAEGRGARVSLAGETLAVLMGSHEQKGGGTFVYELESGEWRQRFATNWSGAVIDTDGNTVVVGSPTDPRLGAGLVLTYVREFGRWRVGPRIQAPEFMLIPFGTSVGVWEDRIVVGASPGRFNEGEAIVYRKAGTNYVEETVLGSGVTQDFFGQSVAISGRTIAVGAPLGDGGLGAVYLFRWNEGTWTRTEILARSTARSVEDFGGAVALGGNVLAAGAPGTLVGPTTGDAGVVVVYDLEPEGPYIEKVRWQKGSGGGFVMELRIVELNQPHRVEYKASLTDSEWTKVYESSPQERRVTVLDATATGETRFYRIVRQ
jgi:hypothetical protein